VAAVGALVLLECFLREAVEGEGGDGAFEMRDGDAPGAVGTTPAGEVVSFDPDQAFVTHTSTFCACVGIRARARRAERITASSAEGGLLPVATGNSLRN
jgi:hypothetical protein